MSGPEQAENRSTLQESGVPQGASTIMEALDAAHARGFTAQLIARTEGMVECGACSQRVSSADLDVAFTQRLEGASDAADMNIVAWATCPNCETGGVLILGYGPNATAADESVLETLDMDNSQAAPPVVAPNAQTQTSGSGSAESPTVTP